MFRIAQDTPVSALRIDRSLNTPQLKINRVLCNAHASGCSGDEPVESPRLVLPLRGVFRYHLHRREFIADANSVFLLDSGDVCRVSHPVDGGDACLVLVPDATLLEETFGEQGWLERAISIQHFRNKWIGSNPRILLTLRVLQASLTDPESPLLVEEIAMALLGEVAALSPDGFPSRFESPPQTPYAARAQALLASLPCEPHSLDSIGRAVHCSPFHLARSFRQTTGFSLHGYQTLLRMALAWIPTEGIETNKTGRMG
jgi:AraC family transcriptional regulator